MYKAGYFGIGIATGLIIGGVIALLYAPVRGDIARAEVSKKFRDVKNKITKNAVDKAHK